MAVLCLKVEKGADWGQGVNLCQKSVCAFANLSRDCQMIFLHKTLENCPLAI